MKNTILIPPDVNDALREKLDRADQHLDKSEFTQAEQLANEVHAASNGGITLSKDDEAHTLCILSECCNKTSRYDDALKHSHSALAAAEAASNLGLQARALNRTAAVHHNRNESDACLRTAERALSLAEGADDKKQQALAMLLLGSMHIHLADYQRALDYCARALVKTEEIGDKFMTARILLVIGHSHRALADYPLAMEYTSRALELGEEIGNKSIVADALSQISCLHSDLLDYTRSLEFKARSLALYEELGEKSEVARTLGNIGHEYYHTGDYHQALEYFKRTLYLSEQFGHRRSVGYMMYGIAVAEQKLGNLDAAYQGLSDTLYHRRGVLKSNDGVSLTLLALGEVLIDQGKIEEGLARLEEGLTLAVELGEKLAASYAHKEMAGAYAKMGDIAKAYDHTQKHYAIKEEIFSEKSRQLIDSFNIRAAIANQERDTKLARLETEQSKRETEVQMLRAEQSEKELGNTTLQLLAQTELLSDLRADLLQIARKIPPTEPAARELRERVKNLPCQSIDWGKFDTQFKAAHPDFVKKLIEAVPDISPMEIRISTLIRMNLKSEEIARLFCVTERAVEFHRLNIRKKMGLKKTDNLSLVLAKM